MITPSSTAALRARVVVAAVLASCAIATTGAQTPLDQADLTRNTHAALVALDRYLETWNSRNPALWAGSLHYPHVRPGPGEFGVSRTEEEYAAGVNFAQTLRTGWDHTEWVSRDVLQVDAAKVHVAGVWQRFAADGRPLATSAITYIVTLIDGRWGIQARFAAGAGTIDAAAADRNGAAARDAVEAFFTAWNAHDAAALASAIHYPHVRIADGQVEVGPTREAFLQGPEPGRQRTWYRTRVDEVRVAQVTANGANLTVRFTRLGRDEIALAQDVGVFLVTLRDGAWKVQARSTMGS
jgi:hypothetical protein